MTTIRQYVMDFLKKRFSLASDPDKDTEENGPNLMDTLSNKRSNIWNGIASKLSQSEDTDTAKVEGSFVGAVRQKLQSVRLFENGDTDSDEEQDRNGLSQKVECAPLIDTSTASENDLPDGVPREINALNGTAETNGNDAKTSPLPSRRPRLTQRQASFSAEEVYMDTVAAQLKSGLVAPDASAVVVSPKHAVKEFAFSANGNKKKPGDTNTSSLPLPDSNLINFESIHNLEQAAGPPVELIVHREDDNDVLYDYSSDDSTEPVYSDNVVHKVGSFDSLLSQDELDETTKKMNEFTQMFVDRVFEGETNSNEDKAKFGQIVRDGSFRERFARCVSEKRGSNQKISEHSFYQLVQYFAVVLFECDEADDFTPAKNLMNMCFTYYYEAHKGGKTERQYLYYYLKSQPIWQSMRYWNAAFFETVQNERTRKPLTTNKASSEDEDQDRTFQENIIFGQLGTFLHNMREFGLSLEWCLEFLRKQAVIGNLKKEQINMLRESIESAA